MPLRTFARVTSPTEITLPVASTVTRTNPFRPSGRAMKMLTDAAEVVQVVVTLPAPGGGRVVVVEVERANISGAGVWPGKAPARSGVRRGEEAWVGVKRTLAARSDAHADGAAGEHAWPARDRRSPDVRSLSALPLQLEDRRTTIRA